MQAVGAQQASLFVTVVAPESGPLKSLTAKDFIARGAQAEVVGAVRPGALLSVELVVDISRQPYGPNPPIEDLRSALQAFVQTIRSGDPSGRIALMQVGNTTRRAAWRHNRASRVATSPCLLIRARIRLVSG